ncbi:Asp/Glu/hydantoin racemase [Alsobacter metallidurans]|uniref:Asp/Glu/hydantoin racemase n=1 Tax=Alsobacter metallidurans TaxID=340221 RepID=A0A917MIW0_9HYPH|nr:aspartate/glutamate racemase family protein [Alsobacter metallidurans]GGH22963.1 Asp/Glu/hydantoin racemase [Alsobacter metallidurans]
MRLLLVNGNTTQAVTEAVCAEARSICAPGTAIEGATARFGAEIVTTHAGNAIAAHAVLDLLAERAGSYDAAILAISFDSGLKAARELFRAPIIGMTEAALLAACAAAPRVRMITFGETALPLYEDLLRLYDLRNRVADVRCIDVNPATYLGGAGRDDAIMAELAAMPPDGAPVVLCGAALAGTAARLQPRSAFRLFDGIVCAVKAAEQPGVAAALAHQHTPIATIGLSPALAEAFGGGG